LRLIVLHYHFRAGGIRRVIELATPWLARAAGRRVNAVVLAGGEAPDPGWLAHFREQLAPTPVTLFLESAFGYASEQRLAARNVTRRVRVALNALLADAGADPCLIWAHNLGLGRNLVLTRELVRASTARGLRLVAHHHDWWFDNRWSRWAEMQRLGFRQFRATARLIFPAATNVCHVAINRADTAALQRLLPGRAHWLPNLIEHHATPAADPSPPTQAWLRRQLDGADAPVWLLPCRFLRRKNVAEAILLTRWLRPEAWLVTTGGPSSADEQGYFTRLQAAAASQRWQVRLGVLSHREPGQPGVAELLAASEIVLLTSIREGFGLPYLEAAAARRPLIARALPNVAPDLAHFGFRFPQAYAEVLVDPCLFDWEAEHRRQTKHFQRWRRQLPTVCRRWAGEPVLLAGGRQPRPVPFSRLTLDAQLEVLARPVGESWERCAVLNPFLAVWKKRAAAGRLRITPWPRSADRWLSGPAYARRFHRLVRAGSISAPADAVRAVALENFTRKWLGTEHQFPLLWT
jgi:glycosyltransferase involved in cell wall biosynthesis